jgi:hypothetical protein
MHQLYIWLALRDVSTDGNTAGEWPPAVLLVNDD